MVVKDLVNIKRSSYLEKMDYSLENTYKFYEENFFI
jgi:hypothetical protein